MLNVILIRAAFSTFISALKQAINPAHCHLLQWQEIVNWFQNWINDHQNVEKDAVGFTIQETVENVKYALVQGVFNKSTNKIEDARRIHADEVDEQVKKQCFGKEKITLFT